MRDGVVPLPDLTMGRHVLRNDLVHLRFDLREIVGRERCLAREVVIEAVLDGRPDGDLRARIKLLHRHRENMRAVVADQFERFGILARDDAHLGVAFERPEDVPDLAVHFDGECGLRQPRPDGRSDVRPGAPARERQRLAVGKGDSQFIWSGRGHGLFP